VLNSKGLAYHNLKEYQKAIDCFDKVLKIDPNYLDVLYNKGFVYHNLEEY